MADGLRAIVVHGGAGDRIPAEGADTRSLHEAMERAVAAAGRSLDSGGSALDAVEAAVTLLEDAPRFNAGRGSVPTSAGAVEMDAGIMCGSTLRAGAVALVTAARNPIALARTVLEDGAHVMLAGASADELAVRAGLAVEGPEYFLAGRRAADPGDRSTELGTVGAVVRDDRGDLAAATSTGGTAGQRPGRIGDSPIVGAGVYAENGSAAVSCTGTGEHVMRAVLAHRIARAVEASGSPQEACERAISGAFADVGGSGGAIALDGRGNLGMCFNTAVMHRAWKVGEEPVRAASA